MESPVAAAKPPLHLFNHPSVSPSLSPHSSSTTTGSSSGNNNKADGTSSGGVAAGGLPGAASVKTIPRSDANPYPTTFVQADTTSFKQVVQMLTGSSETAAKHAVATTSPRPNAAAAASTELSLPRPPHPPQPPLHPHLQASLPTSLKTSIPTGPKRPAFKLYERRHNSFKNLRINPLVPGLFNGVFSPGGGAQGSASTAPNSPSVSNTTTGFSPRYNPEILSPSILDFPSLALSPVTPLSPDPFNRPLPTSASSSSSSAEDRAIAERGFYLHPSPRSSLGADPPRLLPLFPVTSPGVAAADSSA